MLKFLRSEFHGSKIEHLHDAAKFLEPLSMEWNAFVSRASMHHPDFIGNDRGKTCWP